MEAGPAQSAAEGHLEKWNGIPGPDDEVKKSAFPSGSAEPSSDLYQSK